jgi:MFS family permease
MRRPIPTGDFLRTTIANFFFFLNFASFFLLPLHIKALGGDERTVGFVMGMSGLASLLVLPAVGMTIDRFGRRRFLLCGATGMTLASFCFIFIDQIGVALFALRLLQGVSFAAAFTATTTFAAEFAPREQRAQALGLFGLSTLLTHAIAPSLGEEIIHRFGFQTLFAMTIVYTAVVIVLAVRLPSGKVSHSESNPMPTRLSELHWIIGATTGLAGMGFGCVMTFIPTFVRDTGLGRVGFFYAAYTSMAILSRIVGAGLSDSFGRRRVIMPTLLALAASIFALSFVHDLVLLVLAGMMFGAAQGIAYPTLHAFLIDQTSEAQLGRSQALFNGSFNLGVTLSSFIFGIVAHQSGYGPMFALASLTPAAACLVFYLFARTPKTAHTPVPLIDIEPS